MVPQNGKCKEMRLVLSSDAKARLRWTSELHQQFVDAVRQLGGADKATPKSLMRVMGVHGLTLYHLKSHLQKYRMGRSQQCYQEDEKISCHSTNKTTCDGAKEQINNLQMTRMQMEVQSKLHEQIEIQKHLQLRVEAQGNYLRTVLRKAEETISEYGSCSIEAENARAQLAELVSMVETTRPSSLVSELTKEHGSFVFNGERNRLSGCQGSLESSLTSTSEGSKQGYRVNERCKRGEGNFLSLSLMEMQPTTEGKRGDHAETFDLNDEFHSVPKLVDLNSKGDGSL